MHSRVVKCIVEIQPSIVRSYHHARPVIKYNLVKPVVDLQKYDPEGRFSVSVQEHIKARDFENRQSTRKIDVISLTTGECKGTVPLNDFVFGTNPRLDILHRNVVWYRASIRAGTASVKRRGEVRGGGRKPWPQKGTGRARHGSIRSPLWRGGGSAKGPKPRDWSFELPFKVRRMGLRVALSSRLAQHENIDQIISSVMSDHGPGAIGDLTVVEDLENLPQNARELSEILVERNLSNSLLVDGDCSSNPAGIYLFKVTSRNTRAIGEIHPKLNIPELRQ